MEVIYPNKIYLTDKDRHYQMFQRIRCFIVPIVIFLIAWKHI